MQCYTCNMSSSNPDMGIPAENQRDVAFIYDHNSSHSGMMKPTTIQVDMIRKLVKIAEYVDFMEESYRILDTEENWANLDEL